MVVRGGLDIFNNHVGAQELLTRWRDDDDDEEFGVAASDIVLEVECIEEAP